MRQREMQVQWVFNFCYDHRLRERTRLHSAPRKASGHWEDFARQVSGEWDGYGAEFTDSGEPRELPSAVVPEAFREWEVQLYDWQTQCPTIAKENIYYRLTRLLPTVGCEADAATQYSVDERSGGDSKSGVEFLAYHVNGSYIAVWPGRRILREDFKSRTSSKSYVWEDDQQKSFEVEHCFVQDGESRFRVRILQQISLKPSIGEDDKNLPVLKNVTVQREKWESEFQNGEVLGGCSTTGSAFATTQTLQSSELAGVWHCETSFAHCERVGIQPLLYAGLKDEKRDPPRNIMLLPKGLWSELRVLGDGQFTLAAGWLVNPDTAITSSIEFSSIGETKEAYMKFEKRAS
ncbi:hypothetical protein GOP47_0005551 [Adiantum capillus-veneris]|uniref:Uncharacterized protein n=1 Tax=Adiantum capillus-veneris TaxID=13818 RepID=A0A9D4V602_ADICA|nr:hypothetical protein GOP47_0005551 [Adiantum capillus-veneris]